jgi:uncharacterized protein YbcV (DUF1398 family)
MKQLLSTFEVKILNSKIKDAESWVVKSAVKYIKTNDNEVLIDAVYKLLKLQEERRADEDALAERFNSAKE